MASISFDKEYLKLLDRDGFLIEKAKLLLVLPIPQDQLILAKDFIEIDEEASGLRFETLYIILLFQKPNGELFTSVRTAFGKSFKKVVNKKQYYESLIGQDLEIKIR